MDTLRFGSRGAQVEYLQLALQRAGYRDLALDGIFGARTGDAVRDFQQRNGLFPDGVAGRLTWNRLMPYLKGYTTYTVRRGDTFYNIAQKFGTDLRRILTANPTINPQNLQIGSVVYVPYDFALVPTNVQYSYVLLTLLTEGLAVRYPFLKTGSFGQSVMGKNLVYIRIGTGAKEVFYNAAHHANEWLTTPVLLKFTEEYADAFSQGGSIGGEAANTLFTNYSLYLAPMVDPDGVDLVTGVLSSGGYYNQAVRISEQYPQVSFPSGWKANIAGVDLNLQYPANWDEAKRIKFEQEIGRAHV